MTLQKAPATVGGRYVLQVHFVLLIVAAVGLRLDVG